MTLYLVACYLRTSIFFFFFVIRYLCSVLIMLILHFSDRIFFFTIFVQTLFQITFPKPIYRRTSCFKTIYKTTFFRAPFLRLHFFTFFQSIIFSLYYFQTIILHQSISFKLMLFWVHQSTFFSDNIDFWFTVSFFFAFFLLFWRFLSCSLFEVCLVEFRELWF